MSLKFAKSIELIELSLLMSAANLPDADGKSDSKPRRYFLKYPKYIKSFMRSQINFWKTFGLLIFTESNVPHMTIMRWIQQYAPIIDEKIRKYLKKTNDLWRLDETYIKIKGKDAYLYRAVDSEGSTIYFYVSEKRDKEAAKKFLRKALKGAHNQQPRVITTDKYAATELAIIEEQYYGKFSCRTGHRKTKYLNN